MALLSMMRKINRRFLSLSYEEKIRPGAFLSLALELQVVYLPDRKSSHRPKKK